MRFKHALLGYKCAIVAAHTEVRFLWLTRE
jgi:hypothetical protein